MSQDGPAPSGDGDANQVLSELRAKADGLVGSFTGQVEKAALDAKARIAELVGLAEAAAQAIAATKAKVEAVPEAVEKSRSDSLGFAEAAKRASEAATANAADAKARLEAATTDSSAANAAKTAIEGVLKEVQDVRERADKQLAAAEAGAKGSAALAQIAERVEQRVKDYEGKLTELHESKSKSLSDLEVQAKGLLPEMTSAGLSAAFEARRKEVAATRNWWNRALMASLGLLAVVAYLSFFWLPLEIPTNGQAAAWATLVLGLVRRSALIAPLLWFAILASKQRNTLVRIEEDYAHKVVMSNSFEGYKREVAEIGEENAIGRLTFAVIEILRRSPGRFYDKQRSDSPLETLAEGAARVPAIIESTGKAAEGVVRAAKP